MNITDELRKLQELHATGALSDTEFAQAKAKLLRNQSGGPPGANRQLPAGRQMPPGRQGPGMQRPQPGRPGMIGPAALKWRQFQIFVTLASLIVIAIFFFTFLLPQWSKDGLGHDELRQEFDRLKNKINAGIDKEELKKEFNRVKAMIDEGIDTDEIRQEFQELKDKLQKELGEDFEDDS